MKRDEYLSYLRTLSERESVAGKLAGVTKWGLFIAIVYLLWETIPQYARIKDDPDIIENILKTYSSLQFSIIFLTTIAIGPVVSGKSSRFEVRLSPNYFGSRNTYIHMALVFVLPLAAQYHVGLQNSDNYFISIQAKINNYFIITILAALVILDVFSRVYEARSGYPPPLAISGEKGRYSFFVNIIFQAIFIEMFLGNSYSLYIIVRETQNSVFEPVTIVSMNAFLIVYASVFLLRAEYAGQRLAKLANMERDILLHGLTEEEIRVRIQDEFVGYEIGEWLGERLNEVRMKAQALSEHTNNAESFCIEYEKLDQELQHERRGRMYEYLSQLDSLLDDYTTKSDKLLSWLNFAISSRRLNNEKRVSDVLEGVSVELRDIASKTKEEVVSATGKIRELLRTSP